MGSARTNSRRRMNSPKSSGSGSDGPHVHLRPGRHEEQRHEETVGDGVVLHLHGLVALRNEIAQDEAGGEGTEHDIQIEDGRNSRQADEQQIHRTDDHLRVGVGIGNDEPVHVAADALSDLRHGGGRHGDGEEREEDDHRLPGGPGREQKRHGDDGKQLAPGAVGDDLVPHPRAQDAALLQNGQKRAHGRGGERDNHGEPSSSKADSVGQMATTTNAMAKVTAQVAAPRFPSVPVRFFGDIS